MSLVWSYLIVPIVFMLLAMNIYFRVIILKQYKLLRSKDIKMDQMSIFNHKERSKEIMAANPKYAKELDQFSKSLRRLLHFAILGFVLILVCFLFTYFNQAS